VEKKKVVEFSEHPPRRAEGETGSEELIETTVNNSCSQSEVILIQQGNLYFPPYKLDSNQFKNLFDNNLK